MAAVSQEDLKNIQEAFEISMRKDSTLRELWVKISTGKGTYRDAYAYAQLVSNHCSDAILAYFTEEKLPDGKLYYDIAQSVIRPVMLRAHRSVSDACREVQRGLNEGFEVGLNALEVKPELDRIDGIAERASSFEELDQARTFIEQAVENYDAHVVDESIRINADFQTDSGLVSVIIRTAAPGCCAWCTSLAGTYEYDKDTIRKDIFGRHRNCKCILDSVIKKTQRRIWDASMQRSR